MEKLNYEIPKEWKENNEEKINLLNVDLNWIPKEFYEKKINEVKEKDKVVYDLLVKNYDFLKRNNFDNWKWILSAILYFQSLKASWKNNLDKVVSFTLKFTPARVINGIISFSDDINNEIKEWKNKEIVKEKKEIVKENKEIVKENKEIAKENKENINGINEKTVKILKNLVNKKAPEYIPDLQNRQQEYEKQWVDKNTAYLLAFKHLYTTNKDFKEKIGQLPKNLTNALENLVVNEAIYSENIQNQINTFSNSQTEYDNKIKESLQIDEKLDLDTYKLLAEKYPQLVDKFFKLVLQKNPHLNISVAEFKENYKKYLEQWQTDKFQKVYEKCWEELFKHFKNQLSTYPKEYKNIAMQSYVKSIFSILEKSLWFENVEIDDKNFQLNEKWEIKFSFKYNDTKLNIKVDPNWNILMTNYLAKKWIDNKSWIYEVKETKLNNLFTFVPLKDLLTPSKTDYKILLSSTKDVKTSMIEEIEEQVNKKLEKNNALGNETLTKSEIQYETKKQDVAYKSLLTYKPPVDPNYLNGTNWKISPETWKVYNFLQKIENSLSYEYRSFDVLNRLFSNDRFKQLTDSLWEWEDKISTYELFSKLYVFQNDKLNLNKLETFVNKLDKISSRTDLESLPQIEWFKWDMENNKIILRKDDSAEEILESIQEDTVEASKM